MTAIINRVTFILLLIAAVLVICLNSALKVHASSITVIFGHEEVDPRLEQLAAAIPKSALRRPR